MITFTESFMQKLFGTKSVLNPAYRKQLFASLTVCIICASHGMMLGWSAPTLLKIMSESTPLGFPVTQYEESWIGSLHALGAIFGDVVQCFLVNILGRKMCISIMSVPQIFAWVLIYMASDVSYLYIARTLLGFAGAACVSLMPIFLGEISNRNVRGTLVSFFSVALSAGTLTGLILASVLSYYIFPWMVILMPVSFQLLFVFFPETPQFLLSKRREEAAFKSFRFYGNYGSDTNACQQDFNSLKAASNAGSVNEKLTIHDFVTPAALKSYCTSLVLLLLVHFSGLYTFLNYLSEIFSISGAPFDPNVSTVIVGVVQLIGTVTATICIDQYGRRGLLIISMVGVAMATTIFGCYTHLTQQTRPAPYNWIPLVCMVFAFFVGNIGILSVTYVVLVEILPIRIRAIVIPVCFCLLSIFGFIVINFFPTFMHSYGISTSMWSFAGLITGFLIYLAIFLPETKGKSIVAD